MNGVVLYKLKMVGVMLYKLHKVSSSLQFAHCESSCFTTCTCTVRTKDLILRSIERRPQMQFSFRSGGYADIA